MPRGVYERKSAQLAAPEQSGVGPVASKKSAKKRIRNRKPAAHKSAATAATPPTVPAAVKEPVQLVSSALLGTPDFKNKRVSIDAISFEELKAYAKFIGVSPRDIERLNEDRLRVNCKAHIYLQSED